MDLIFGTWQTSPSDGFWTGQSAEESEKTLSCAVRHGLKTYDTAQSYGKGQAEQTLGKILNRFSTSFDIDTKFMPTSKPVSDLVALSLSRLRIRRLGRLYIHWPRTGLDLEPYISQMRQLKEDGLISKIGLSNPSASLLEKLIQHGSEPDCIQIPVSLLWSRDLTSLGPICKDKGIEIIAYSPSGMGLLSGKYRNASDLPDARGNLFCFNENCIAAYHELLSGIFSFAMKHSCSCTAVALAWTASQNIDAMVIGARSVLQLEENLKSLSDVSLDDCERSLLDHLSQELGKKSEQICSNIFSYIW